MPDARNDIEGIVVQNTEVQGYIRKHGAPVHSKPHGAGKMVLYYPKAPGDAEESTEAAKDFAGTSTPGNRDLVIQKPLMGSTEIASTVSHRPLSGGGAHPQMSPSSLGNPSASLADVDITNADALDEKVTKLEDEQKEKKAEEKAKLSTAERVSKVSQEPASDPPAPSAEKEKEKKSNEIPVPGEPAPGLSGDVDEPYYQADEPTT